MSRYHHSSHVPALLEAAQHWRNLCLIEDGSLFGGESLWTQELLAELNQAFIQNPLEGNNSYLDKLRQQLAEASPQAARLMAELHWVLLLFPHNINPSTKRSLIQELWLLGKEPLDSDHPLLSDSILSGAAHSGTAYNTHRWRELTFLIHIAEAIKALPKAQRQQHLADPWGFSEWLASVPREGYRQFRHMLRWMLFPDEFERICTSLDKYALLEHFEKIPLKRLRKMSDVEIDRLLLALRQRLENESGEPVDFYDSPWLEQWRPSPGTWLMAWNPKHWPWKSYQDDRLKIASGENVTLPWRTASTQPREGDTFYLVRVGQEPRGLIARGNIASAPYEDDHYNAERAANGETARFVDITLTDLRDPGVDAYISMADLQAGTTDGQNWSPQGSGIEIKSPSAKLIGKLWETLPPVKVSTAKATSSKQQAIQMARPVNTIFYGPPGTGKTYHLQKHLMPRYESEAKKAPTGEWLEEQLANTAWWEAIALALADLGGKATVNDLLIHPYFKAKARVQGRPNSPNLRATCWGALQIHTVLESSTVKYAEEKRQPPLIFDKQPGGHWVLTGDWEEAGEGLREKLAQLRQGPASDDARIKRHLTVTFHQSYSYEDFVEGIRPQTTEDGGISYEVRDGLFKAFCQRASQDPHQRYALFIDEINRGNISRIFGELITLIETDKRAWWDEEGMLVEGIELVLPYSGNRFGVPKNLDIYATMNTADRSIALMDAALRRRFHFQELMPEPRRIPGSQGDGYIPDGEGGLLNLRALLESINLRLRYLLHRDQTFGHAYFTEVKDLEALRRVMVYDIIPMLAEYFYDDWRQIRRVLADEGADVEQQLITVEILDPTRLFPGNGDSLLERPNYRVKLPGEISADAIRKIYESLEAEA
ncbi:McrB family protein [Halomonas mongoliensis]|uniref:McrB family protein n=1 Tax=Halomonas mongoliensis TaxID=321265 RepID=UPI00403ADDF6